MQHCSLEGLFADGFAQLNRCFDTWQKLLAKHLPRLNAHITKQLLGFMGMTPAEYVEAVKNQEPLRHILPSQYTTPWFMSMSVGGEHPAPSSLAPRVMDCLLLDGHMGVVFQVTACSRMRACAAPSPSRSRPPHAFRVPPPPTRSAFRPPHVPRGPLRSTLSHVCGFARSLARSLAWRSSRRTSAGCFDCKATPSPMR